MAQFAYVQILRAARALDKNGAKFLLLTVVNMEQATLNTRCLSVGESRQVPIFSTGRTAGQFAKYNKVLFSDKSGNPVLNKDEVSKPFMAKAPVLDTDGKPILNTAGEPILDYPEDCCVIFDNEPYSLLGATFSENPAKYGFSVKNAEGKIITSVCFFCEGKFAVVDGVINPTQLDPSKRSVASAFIDAMQSAAKLAKWVYVDLNEEKDKNVLIESETPYSEQIRNLSNLSFNSIREISVNNNTMDSQVPNRGATPLKTETELFKYMVSFGNMHYSKIKSALDILFEKKISENLEIIDWGCGQALATMVLGEYFNNNRIDLCPSKIILIEPSELTIKRAGLHASLFFPNSQINTLCKYFDDLKLEDIQTSHDSIKIHFFSNILDVEFFSLKNLFELISSTQKGLNFFVCVSPNINDIKTERLESFKRYFEKNNDTFELLMDITTTKNSTDPYWNCNNNYNRQKCDNHLVCGCENQWTRVIKVFKVDLY